MNRPNEKDYYEHCGLIFHFEQYIEAMNKYCDELEHQLDVDRLTIDCESATIEQYRKTIDTYEKEIINLKQALDKATDELALNGKMVGMTKDFIMYSKKATKEEWEQWLLNGE